VTRKAAGFVPTTRTKGEVLDVVGACLADADGLVYAVVVDALGVGGVVARNSTKDVVLDVDGERIEPGAVLASDEPIEAMLPGDLRDHRTRRRPRPRGIHRGAVLPGDLRDHRTRRRPRPRRPHRGAASR
jgi:hypothetical protein